MNGHSPDGIVPARSNHDSSSEREIWERLLAEQPIPDIGASRYGWEVWSSHCAPGQCRTVVAYREDRPVAITPLVERQEDWRRLRTRVLASPGDDHWHCGHVVTGQQVAVGAEALLSRLIHTYGWDMLQLGPVLTDSPIRHALVEVGRRMGLRPLVDPLGGAPCVRLEGAWEAYCQSRSAKLRSVVAQAERRLAAQGPISLEECRGGVHLERNLDAFLKIEGSGWKGKQGSAIESDERLRRLYTELARAAAERGALRLYLLRSGERVVAADYCVKHGDGIFVLKIGYDAEQARCSPGHVLRKRVLEQLMASRDATIYDLMAGGGEHMSYKQRWANCVRGYDQIRLFHPRSVRAAAASALLRLKRSVGFA